MACNFTGHYKNTFPWVFFKFFTAATFWLLVVDWLETCVQFIFAIMIVVFQILLKKSHQTIFPSNVLLGSRVLLRFKNFCQLPRFINQYLSILHARFGFGFSISRNHFASRFFPNFLNQVYNLRNALVCGKYSL